MPIPTTRHELLAQIEPAFSKLKAELHDLDANLADEICVADWTVKDLLAVRLWWTRAVLDWIDCGRHGNNPELPASGYGWNETPRLNAAIVQAAAQLSATQLIDDLDAQYRRLLVTIDELNDAELTQVGQFTWAGNYPICRWLSINTTRQYVTARTHIRRAKRSRG